MAELLDRYRLSRDLRTSQGRITQIYQQFVRHYQETMPDKAYIPSMKINGLYIGIMLILVGIVVLGMSITMIHNSPKAMLGIVLGGVLVQAGIAAFAMKFSQKRQ